MVIGNPQSMRNLNKNLVFNLIRENKIMTRPEICAITGLKPPSVKHIIEALLEDDMIKCLGKGESGSGGGPRPELYSINEKICYFIGLDANIRRLAGVIIDFGGNIIASQSTYVNSTEPEVLMLLLKEITRDIIQAAKINIDQVVEISIGFAAPVNKNRDGVAASPFDILYQFDVKRFSDYLGCSEYTKITLENDANAVGMGSCRLSEALKNKENVLCIIIRGGVGLSLIINGEIYRGYEGLTGNITNSENVFGEFRIIDRINHLVETNSASIDSLKRKIIDRPDLHNMIGQNEQIKVIARDCFRKTGEYLAELILTLNPDAIIFAGELIDTEPSLFYAVVEGCENRVDIFFSDFHNKRSNIYYHHTRMDMYSIALYSAYSVMHNHSQPKKIVRETIEE